MRALSRNVQTFLQLLRLDRPTLSGDRLIASSASLPSLGVGLLGFGYGARTFHAPILSAVPGLHLHAILERSGDRAAQAYPGAVIFRTLEALLADPAIHLVVIATPNATHHALARQCLLAGRHVVIDKPFAATSQQAAELIDLAHARHLVAAPFHNRRWDADFLTIHKLLKTVTLGRLVTFDSHWDRFRPLPRTNSWKELPDPANGLLFDLGPHLVDQCIALFGRPHAITASVRTDRDNPSNAQLVDDAFDIRLDYPGLIARCRATMLAAQPAPRFLLHGTSGSFQKYGVDPQESVLAAGLPVPSLATHSAPWIGEPESAWGTLTLAPRPATPTELLHEPIPSTPGDYRLFYANVRDAIHGTAPLIVPPEAGFATIRLLELARQSSHEARTLSV